MKRPRIPEERPYDFARSRRAGRSGCLPAVSPPPPTAGNRERRPRGWLGHPMPTEFVGQRQVMPTAEVAPDKLRLVSFWGQPQALKVYRRTVYLVGKLTGSCRR